MNLSASIFLLIFLIPAVLCDYKPTWESLDTRPLPAWYDEAKFGIFIHWGVFSVPSFRSEWFWWYWKHSNETDVVNFMKKNYPPDFTYQDFAALFKTEFYNPNQWADIFKASGARYVVLTSKHHEGFTMWPSKTSWNWNSMDTGPHRDLVGELATAIRKRTKLVFGLYHSLFEWFNPVYLQDKANNWKTQNFVQEKTEAELFDLVNTYKPDIVWSDGDAGAPPTYWNSQKFLAWLYNKSPVKNTVVTNDRWGGGTLCKHGGFFTCNDRYNPGKLQKHKWENAMTIDKASWGYRRNAKLSDYLDMDSLVQILAETVSCGGNLLMNIGPTADGRIAPIFEERLRQMGQWLGVNGEAIYSSQPWTFQNDTVTPGVCCGGNLLMNIGPTADGRIAPIFEERLRQMGQWLGVNGEAIYSSQPWTFQNDTVTPGVWYTTKKTGKSSSVYAIVLDWPKGDTLHLGAVTPSSNTQVTMLGLKGLLQWKKAGASGIDITTKVITANRIPCKWAWVFKFQYLV